MRPSIDPGHSIERIEVTREVEILASKYIEKGALGEMMRADALHIAAATVERRGCARELELHGTW